MKPLMEENNGVGMLLHLQSLWIMQLGRQIARDHKSGEARGISMDMDDFGRWIIARDHTAKRISMNIADFGRWITARPSLNSVLFPNCPSWGKGENPIIEDFGEPTAHKADEIRQELEALLRSRHADITFFFQAPDARVVGTMWHKYQEGDQIWF